MFNGGPITVIWASQSCGPGGWLVLLLIPHTSGRCETNPGPTNTHKQVWIYDICHRQIRVRKQISIKCNRIEHRVYLRCVGIRLAQYTDTWTCHQHKKSRITTNTDLITTPPSKNLGQAAHPLPPTPPTPPKPKQAHIPLSPVPPGLVMDKPYPLTHSHPTRRPEPNTYTCHTLDLHLSPHSSQTRHPH